jgi:two-component system OmpR family response regulator
VTVPREPESLSSPGWDRTGGLVLDPATGRAVWRGALLDLTPTEFRLLAALAARPGTYVPGRELAETLWGTAMPVGLVYLALYLRSLRSRLGDDPRRPRIIRSNRNGAHCWTGMPPLVERTERRRGPAMGGHRGALPIG